MNKFENKSKYKEFENRCFYFAKDIRLFFKLFSKKLYNLDDIKQVIRSSGSIGANYIEANQSLGTKDFLMRLRISKKRSKGDGILAESSI
jgi:four helix bundle protein